MQTFVTSKNGAHPMAKKVDPTHWICILDPADRIFITHRLQKLTSLHLHFDDVLDEGDINAPTFRDVERILVFGAGLSDDARVLVNCAAGVSRSTAAALIIMAQETGDIEDSVQRLLSQRPNACPNSLITRWGDQILGMDGALHQRAEEVAQAHMKRTFGI